MKFHTFTDLELGFVCFMVCSLLCSYMVEKNRKLQNQFDTEASGSSSSEKSIFRGVSIFVDGFTVPSSQVYLLSQNLNYFLLTFYLAAEN